MEILLNPNVQWILLGTMMLGFSSGLLGSFAFLKKRSLLGDALSHAALPGVCIAFLLSSSKSIPILLFGALLAGLLGAFLIQFITRHSRIKQDAALGIVLSVFFAGGLILLTLIQQSGTGNKAGLDTFIFGQAASMVGSDVRVMALCAALVTAVTFLLFKELKIYCFDPEFAAGIGFQPGRLDVFLMVLLTSVIVIGMQSVGVVLMAALLIIPAATARLWTDNLRVMVALAGLSGALSGAFGTLLSTLGFKMPTGPLIVIAATAVFLVSLVFAPRRGLLGKLLRHLGSVRSIAREHLLREFYEQAEDAENWDIVLTVEALIREGGKRNRISSALQQLKQRGLVERGRNGFSLTPEGRLEAYNVVKRHRLWEMYLMHENQLASDHVHRDADFSEHVLSPELVSRLEELLLDHKLEMKLPPSVHPLEPGREAV